MADLNLKLTPSQKRKLLLVLRIIILTVGLLYLIFMIYNNFIAESGYSVYFATQDANYLEVEKREFTEEQDIYLQLFAELKAGPQSSELNNTIPEGSELLDYNIDADKIILNFNFLLRTNHWGGSTGEILTVYSIVNTYTDLSEIEMVEIKLEGENVDSLVGHLDLSRPLRYNNELIADN